MRVQNNWKYLYFFSVIFLYKIFHFRSSFTLDHFLYHFRRMCGGLRAAVAGKQRTMQHTYGIMCTTKRV